LLLAALLSEAAGSLCSQAAFSAIAPQQNCGRYATTAHLASLKS